MLIVFIYVRYRASNASLHTKGRNFYGVFFFREFISAGTFLRIEGNPQNTQKFHATRYSQAANVVLFW